MPLIFLVLLFALPALADSVTTPPYVLPTASASLGGTKMAAACSADNHVASIVAGELTCSADKSYTLPAASTTLGGVKMASACASGHVSSIGAGGELTCSADAGGSFSGLRQWAPLYADTTTSATTTAAGTATTILHGNASGAPTFSGVALADHVANLGTTTTLLHGNAAGQPTYAGIVVGDFTANQGTVAQSLHGNAAGQPSWTSAPRIVWMTQDRTISSTTASTTTDLVMPIAANASFAFDCLLVYINGVTTSTMRFAVDAPASPTRAVAFQMTSFTTSATTVLGDDIKVQWATTCTGCTRSVTASVLTTISTAHMVGTLVNGANAGNVTIFFAGSAAQLHTLKKGSMCTYWTT